MFSSRISGELPTFLAGSASKRRLCPLFLRGAFSLVAPSNSQSRWPRC
jgi:hypothetical protein